MPLFINILLLLNSIFHISPVFAQNTKLKSDYNYSFSIYQQTYSQFQQSRQAYLKFSTLNTQEAAVPDARKAQLARLETVKTYLYLQKDSLSTHQISSPTETEIILQNINQKIEAFDQLSKTTSSITSIEQINQNNDSFNTLYEETKELIIQAQIRSQANRLLETLKQISQLLDSLNQGPIPNPAKQSWITQTKKDLEKANQEINSALQAPLLKKVKNNPYQKNLKDSLEYLNQSQETQQKILKNALEIKNLL